MNPRYEFFFRNNDTPRRLFRTRLRDRDYTGSEILEVKHNGSPVTLQVKTSGNLFEPIRGVVANIGAIADTAGFEIMDLYTEDDRKWLVVIDEITEDNTVIRNVFTGWLSPFNAGEAYAQKPFIGKLSATCGIGTLKDYPFCVSGTNRPAIAKFSMYYVLRTCLYWLGYELPVYLSLNTIEKSMTTAGQRPMWPYSVLADIGMDTHQFVTDTGMGSCYEVLTALLDILNATIVQYPGYWRIVRIDEIAQYIADDGNAPVLVYEQPANHQFYGKSENLIRPVHYSGVGTPLTGGELSIVPSEKKLTVNFEYGSLKNELKNGNISQGLQNWVSPHTLQPVVSGQGGFHAVGDGSEENPYGIRIMGTTNDWRQREDKVVIGQFIDYPQRGGTSDVFKLSLKFRNYRTSMAKFSLVAAVQGKGIFMLQEDGTWTKAEAPKNKSSWYLFKANTYRDSDGFDKPSAAEGTFEIESSPVPGTGKFRLWVQLYRGVNLPFYTDQSTGAIDPTAYMEFRDIRLTRRDLAVSNLTGEKVQAEAPGVDRKRKGDTLTVRLGDQTSAKITRTILKTAFPATYEYIDSYYLRYGALLRGDDTATMQWLRLGGNPGDPKAWGKIQQHMAHGRLEMTGKPARAFTGDLLQRNPDGQEIGPLDILHFEELDTPERACYMVPFRGWEWDLKRNIVRVDAVEVLHVPGVTRKGFWDSPDGAIPMADGDDNIVPAKKSRYDGFQFTPGQIRENIERSLTGVGRGFAFDPTKGEPVVSGAATLLFNSIRKQLLVRLYK